MAEAYLRAKSFVLIRPTVWPQCTNVTHRQTGRTGQDNWTDSIGRTVLQTVAEQLPRFQNPFLANVVHVRYMLSPVRRLSSVTLVRPTQAVQIFGNISSAFDTLAIH